MHKQQRVLIVDDIPENIHILLNILKDDFMILTATSGEQALEVTLNEPIPDIILLDIQLPGIDGYEVCKRLKANKKTKDIPIIFVTVLTENIDEAKGLKLGAIDYITKPINSELLKIRLINHLKLKNQKDILQESLVNFQNIFDMTMEMIVLTDKQDNIVDINQSGVNMLGYSKKSELIGSAIHKHIVPSDLEFVLASRKENNSHMIDVELLKKDGTTLPVLARGRNIMYGGKEVRLSTLMDLTEIKEKEQQLMQQSRLAQIGEMLSMIAHQWRQPLTAISATSMSLEFKAEQGNIDKETVLKKAKNISNYTQRLSKTIDEFRNFFKPDRDKEDILYSELINSVLYIAEGSMTNQNIELIKELNCNTTFHVYRNELIQVILNLIKNAEDILLEREIENPKITIKTNTGSLTVSDNAGGVPDDIMDKIFDPYFSTKLQKNGTGLGLYMSKIIIENHCAGKLSVMNDEHGAVFKISL